MAPAGVWYSKKSTSLYCPTTSPKVHRMVKATEQPVPRRDYAQKVMDKESPLEPASPTSKIPMSGSSNPENLTPEKSNHVYSRRLSVSCPYHDPVLRLLPGRNNPANYLNTMERFMKEGPSDQYALHIRPDTGQLSTSKGCSCKNIPQEDVSALTYLAIIELDRVCEESFIGIYDTAHKVNKE